jgi:Flp pilus assembly protein TadG
MILGTPRSQNGASMVEMALVIAIFLSLVFAIFEFALAVFYASRLSEATREGARFAVVHNTSIENIQEMSCSEIEALGFQQCSADVCGDIIESMNKLVNIEPSNIYIRYQCATTGFTGQAGFPSADKEIYSITVKLQGVQYPLIMPGILGLSPTITMPSFETTRLSEDLWSPED